MVTIVKHEWHSVDSQFAYELTEEILSEIYPDLDEDEISELLVQIEMGYKDLNEVLEDAFDNNVDIEWERQYDDWYTERKGGYDVTYELGDHDSWHEPDTPSEPTHKCTKCKWTGQKYEADYVWQDIEGNEIDESRQVCPYCESDIEFTEHGIQQEEERAKRIAALDDCEDE